MKRKRIVVTAAVAILAGCDGLLTPPDRSRIELEPAEVELMVGDTFWVQASVYDRGGREVPDAVVEWSRTDIGIVGRDVELCCGKPGNVRARLTATGPGVTWMYAESGGDTDSIRVKVRGHEISLVSLYSGSVFSCGLTEGGWAYCWGGRYQRIPEAHVTRDFFSPAPVPGGVALRTMEIGHEYACGLSETDEAYCWGWRTLGRGNPEQESAIPLPVAGGLRFASLTAGFFHACGLTENGEAYCWGSDLYGQLGAGDPAEECEGYPCSTVPVPVVGGHRFRLIAAGAHFTCGITLADEIYCWGLNNLHQLGNEGAVDLCGDFFGDHHCSRTPVPVQDAPALDTLLTGGQHACGLASDGKAHCWGSNRFGELGGAQVEASSSAVPVDGGHTFRSLSTSGNHTCAIAADGRAFCWGSNSFGQTGTEPAETCAWSGVISKCQRTPVEVSGGLAFTAIEAGGYHTCAMTAAGLPYCWGSNAGGRLGIGDGAVRWSAVPVQVYGTM